MFRSPTAVVVWIVWLLFAVANWIDLAVQGRDQVSAVAAAILLLATGAAYVTAQRPRIIADDAGVDRYAHGHRLCPNLRCTP